MAAAIWALDGGTAEGLRPCRCAATVTQAVAAAVFAAGPLAWASHATAGTLWGMPGVEPTNIEILTPPERKVGLSGVRGHRSAALFSKDLTTLKRIPATAPERTLVDLSARYDDGALARILDDGLRRRVIRLDRLRACTGRLAGAPGRSPSAIQSLLSERLPGYDPGDSDLETRVLRLLVVSGFPPPVQQHRLRVAGRSIRVDLAYPDAMLAIELDGWEHHRTRTAFDDDRARANLLVADGWSLVRFTSRSPDNEIIRCTAAARERFGRSGAA